MAFWIHYKRMITKFVFSDKKLRPNNSHSFTIEKTSSEYSFWHAPKIIGSTNKNKSFFISIFRF